MKKQLFIVFVLTGLIGMALPPNEEIQQYSPESTVFINDNDAHLEIQAGGKDIYISGNKNTIHFSGVCKKLIIKGDNNDIDIDTVSAIEITGDNNFVAWRFGPDATSKPTITDKGGYNNVGKRSGEALKKDEN